MNETRETTVGRRATAAQALAALLMAGLLACAGCGGKQAPADDETFATPEEAAAALVAALDADDVAAAGRLLGEGAADDLLVSGDPVADAADRARVVAQYRAKQSLVADGDDRRTLVIGEDGWPMPVPIVRTADGRWKFDGAAGIDELIYRRVGGNEYGAIDVMYGYVNAQVDYASAGRDGDAPGVYALKLLSDEGLHNGLYWQTTADEPPSPAGAFVAAAAGEGYRAADGEQVPYHGYYYRMLYAQGPNANGGAREYFKDGLLTEGFALIAWPADYGSSGVMTFMVNRDGVVFQKDLGPETASVVASIKAFDPDATWTAITPDAAREADTVTQPVEPAGS